MEEWNWTLNRWEVVAPERAKALDKLFGPKWAEHANDLFNSDEDEIEDNRWELVKDITPGRERMFFSPVTHEFKSIRRAESEKQTAGVRPRKGRVVSK